MPWTEGTANDFELQGASGLTIPNFSYLIAATKDSKTYKGVMVGASPFAKPPTGTTISTVIVPLKVTIGSDVFDPTAANSCGSVYI